MEERSPVVIIHRGNQRYLRDALGFARENGNDVYLIGDNSNRTNSYWVYYKSLNCVLCDEFCALYKHLSSNPYKYELICFQRYFWLYEFMAQMGFESCIHMDSDMLLYVKVDRALFVDECEVACSFEDPSLGLNGSASIHFSFWTLEALHDFLLFLIDVYKNKVSVLERQYEKEKDYPGGICDMRLLSFWIAETSRKVISLRTFYDKIILDQGIKADYICGKKVIMNSVYGIRRVFVSCNGELVFRTTDGHEYPVGAIHFQGQSKMFMHSYYKMRGTSLFLLFGFFEHWANRVYEKVLRTFGIEKDMVGICRCFREV